MKMFGDDFEKEFERMRQRLDKMLGSLSPPGTVAFHGGAGWRPSLDLYEGAGEFMILVDVAGMQAKDVEVIVDSDVVRISGSRFRLPQRDVTRVHHMEIDFGPFRHAVRLPAPVNPDGATSTYKDGFLTIRLPKQKKASGKIMVAAAEG